jgi:hypothetical protein
MEVRYKEDPLDVLIALVVELSIDQLSVICQIKIKLSEKSTIEKWITSKPLEMKWAKIVMRLRAFFRKIEKLAKLSIYGTVEVRTYLRTLLITNPLAYLKQLFLMYNEILELTGEKRLKVKPDQQKQADTDNWNAIRESA